MINKLLLCVLILFVSISCEKKEFKKEIPALKKTKPVDSLLLKKADSLMVSGKAAYNRKDLAQCEKDLASADSILRSQEQWSLAVGNLINTISLAQATKQSQDSIDALIDFTQQIVDRLPKNDWNRGNFYQKKSSLAAINFEDKEDLFYALKALDVFLANPEHPNYHATVSFMYQTLGYIEEDLSNYEKAISFYKKSILVNDKDKVINGHSYGQLFNLLSKTGKQEEALQLIERIEEENLLEGNMLFTKFDYCRDRAYFYLELKQYDKALQMLEEQNALIEGTAFRVHFSEWYQDQLKSDIYSAMGEYPKAIAILKAIKVEEGTSNRIKERRSVNNYLLAKNYLLMGDEENYQYHSQKAINFHLPQNEVQRTFFDSTNYENVISKKSILRSLQTKSAYCLKKYTLTKEDKYKKLALHTFEEQHKLINQIGNVSEEDYFLNSFNYKKFYDDYFSLLHEIWLENPTQKHFYKVLTIADQSKNNVILGEIRKMQQVRLFKNIPPTLLQKEQDLRYTLDTISIVDRNGNYSKIVDSLKLDLESVKKILKRDHPKYYELSYGGAISIENILEAHFKEDNIVSFLVGDTHIYVLNKKGDTQVFDKIKFNKTQLENVEDYLRTIRKPGAKTYVEQEKAIFTSLFKAYTKTEGRTVLSLDDVLHLLPVEGIIFSNKPSENQSFVRVNTILTYQKYNTEVKSDPLIFAPFAASENSKRYLPGTLKEATNIKNVMGGSVKINAEATKKVFLEQASNSGVIHIATHASVNLNAPLESTIFFSETLDQKPSATQLQVNELYGLQLDNELVTLSACETGLGKEIKGKGLQSISNAFAFAGVGSTVMSLWQVPDNQTVQIMTAFYVNLKDGQPKDVALQNAKLTYLKTTEDPLLKHPFYWAGFVLSGDTSPMQSSTPSYLHIVLGVLLLLAIGCYFYCKRGKK